MAVVIKRLDHKEWSGGKYDNLVFYSIMCIGLPGALIYRGGCS